MAAPSPEQLTKMFVSKSVFKVEKVMEITKEIPKEMVTEILLRLPVKSLVKFQSVCKGWCGLIRSPQFIDMHFKHPSQESLPPDYIIFKAIREDDISYMLFYSCNDNGGLVRMANPLGFPFFSHNWWGMCGACNGIICVEGGKSYSHPDAIYLCNPATRQSRRLPNRPFRAPTPEFRCQRLACGIGFDSVKNDFKFVYITRNWWKDDERKMWETDGSLQCEIYDLSSNTWREVQVMLPDAVVKGTRAWVTPRTGNAIYFNGCIHWTYEAAPFSQVILCFDIINEVMRQIQCPRKNLIPEDLIPENMITPFVMDNSLALGTVAIPVYENVEIAHGLKSTETCMIFIWALEGYGGANEQWVKRFSLGPFTPRLREPFFC